MTSGMMTDVVSTTIEMPSRKQPRMTKKIVSAINMVGRVIGTLYPPKRADGGHSTGPLLEVRDLTDGRRFRDVSFSLARGEILGLAGLIGAGRSEIIKGICGLHPGTRGDVTLEGAAFPIRSYRESIDRGVVSLSEDRKRDCSRRSIIWTK